MSTSDTGIPDQIGGSPAPADFRVVTKRTVVSEVMRRMRELIAAGNYRPGDRIPTELELSRLFGVGRSTVREAVKVFEHLGVLEAKAAKGTFVRDRANISAEAISWAVLLGNDDLKDVFQLREVIERASFARLVRDYHAGKVEAQETIDRMATVVEEIRDAAERSDSGAVVEGDYEFHGLVFRASGNRLFAELYETLHSFMRLEIQVSYKAVRNLMEVATDHEEMVAAVRTRSAEAAIERHASHFDRIRRLLSVS
ncbi:MAG: FadR/GntR family transcriptional regulator [bacterium]